MINTILVTGGAGFIGSNLIDKLILEGNKVICLDNFDVFYPRQYKEDNMREALKSPLYFFKEGDINDTKVLEDIFSNQEIDTVVHLAAKAGVRPSILNPQAYFKVNVEGTLNLLEIMRKYGVKKIILASSSSIYGNNEKIPYSETDVVDFPISPYAASKKSAELLTYNYYHLYNFSIINLRFFTVFGPRQRPDLAIYKFFKKNYEHAAIQVFGDGTTSRDYTYIDDIIAGVVASIKYLEMRESVYEIINLGNNNPIMLVDLIEMIEDTIGERFIIKNKPMQPGDVNKTFADISKAKELLNFTPKTSLKEGLVEFKKWFEENR